MSAELIRTEIEKLKAEFGDVPPPWIFAANSHPYSIQWRMGGGETFMDCFSSWWNEQRFDETQKISYFLKWPAPPRWLAWMATVIWDLEPLESGEFDYSEYFQKLREFGFQGTAEYEEDLDNEEWLKYN